MKTYRAHIPTQGFDLKLRIVLAVFAIVLPGMLIMAFLHISNMRSALEDVLRGRGDLIVSSLDSFISRGQALDDPELLQNEISRLIVGKHGVSNIRVYAFRQGGLDCIATRDRLVKVAPDRFDYQAAQQDRSNCRSLYRGSDRILDIAAPIHRDHGVVGSIRIEIPLLDADEVASAAYVQSVLSAFLLILITLTLLWMYIRKEINSPVERLVEGMGLAKAGNLEALVDIESKDEFGWLAENFNQMLRRIRDGNRENTSLMQRIGKFNEELREKIDVATQELARKNEELLRANEDLFRAQRRLGDVERLASLGQFASQMAHELGTPLNSISGHIQILASDEGLDASVHARLKVIEGQMDRLTRIIQEALNNMRFHVPKIEMVSVNAILERLIAFASPGFSGRKVELAARLHPGCPPCPGDPAQLEQVFLNLITNALDAMPNGGTLAIETLPALGDAPVAPAAAELAPHPTPSAAAAPAVAAGQVTGAAAATPALALPLPTPAMTPSVAAPLSILSHEPAASPALASVPAGALAGAGVFAGEGMPAVRVSRFRTPAPQPFVPAPSAALPAPAPAAPSLPEPGPAPDGVLVRFRDVGHGISREDMKRLFEPLFSTKGIGKGTGLGLAICQQIIRAHGGAIQVESELGKGSVFSVRLRVSPSRPHEV
ncbi:MAG: HAMP domain-containing protein [Planctomycetes bacterium]|nr:HAMP domain-containing protein [Planctomycetota bacterium]